MLPLHLDWSAPTECPTGQQVEQELRRITRPRPGRALLPLEARAVITRTTTGYHLALQLTRHGEPSEAHFDSPVCAPLRKAATLVLALAYGDGVELNEDSSEPEPVPANTNQVTALPSPAKPPRDTDQAATEARLASAHDRLLFAPWVAATLTSGFIGPSRIGADAGLAFGGRYLSALGRVSAFPPGTAGSRAGVTAELSAVSAALGGCVGWPSTPITLRGCLAFEAGLLQAHSTGAQVAGSATAPWLALNPALALSLPISRPFALRAELGGLVPFKAPRFNVAPLGTIYGSARVALRASVGVSVAL